MKVPADPEVSKSAALCLLADVSTTVQLSESQQQAYLLLLSRGASPAGACEKLGLSLPAIAAAMDANDGFRKQIDRVHELLSQNVAAALYRAAMEGSVSAQTFYLKNRPPPDWSDTADAEELSPEELTDEELLAEIEELAMEASPKVAPGTVQSGCTAQP